MDCSSGLHARWAPYYIRRTRVSAATPVYKVLKDAGVLVSERRGTWVWYSIDAAARPAITTLLESFAPAALAPRSALLTAKSIERVRSLSI